MTPRAPETFTAGTLVARRPTAADLPFVLSLMADPAMHRHRPDPAPPAPSEIEAGFTRDLDHWQRHGFGRWIVIHEGAPVGLCGLTHRAGYPGLNISYHLAPPVWGRGWATELATALVAMAETTRLSPYLHALVRAANPASVRVLDKLGFRDVGRVQHKGAESLLRVRTLGRTDPMVHFGGTWKPIVSETATGLLYQLPVTSGPVDFQVDLPITAADLGVLRTDPDRAALAYAVLHHMGQTLRASGRIDDMAATLHHVLTMAEADLIPWLKDQDSASNGAVSNLLRLTEGADMDRLRHGAWLPLPRVGPA